VKRSMFAMMSVVAFSLLAPQAEAQCPTGTNPLQILSTTYAYKVFVGGIVPQVMPLPGTGSYYSAGRFTPSVGRDSLGNPRGVLSIIASVNTQGSVTRQETAQGSYTILPDCSGGSLIFALDSGPLQIDFWFGDTLKALFGVTTSGFPGVLEGNSTPGPNCGACATCINLCQATTGLDRTTCKFTDASCSTLMPPLTGPSLARCLGYNCAPSCPAPCDP
jgi:hypothetical protein